MKATPPVALRIIKFCLALTLLLSLQSCSHQEEEGSVCLNIPSSVCQRLAAARSVDEPEYTMTVFVTGDWEAKKDVLFSTESLYGDGISVEFDGIRGGSKVRVVCLPEGESSYDTCLIGVSDEVTILGGQENAANVQLSLLQITCNASANTMSLNRNLPGCTYKWYFKTTDEEGYSPLTDYKREVTLTTSTNVCDFSDYIISASGFGYITSTHLCTIYCNGTKIITLRPDVGS